MDNCISFYSFPNLQGKLQYYISEALGKFYIQLSSPHFPYIFVYDLLLNIS